MQFGRGELPKVDRRVQRTRASLHDALLSLVAEREYDSITVQDILDRANVGRSTFYVHFRDKEDLFLSGMEPLRAVLMRVVKAGGETREALDFTVDIFRHAGGYRQAYKAIVRGRMGVAAERLFFILLVDLIREDLQLRGTIRQPAQSLEAVAYALAGALMAMIAWWVDQSPPPPPEKIHAMFLRIVQSGIT